MNRAPISTLTNSQVAAGAVLPAATIARWVARGYFVPSYTETSPARPWSFADVVVLRVAALLIDVLGMKARAALFHAVKARGATQRQTLVVADRLAAAKLGIATAADRHPRTDTFSRVFNSIEVASFIPGLAIAGGLEIIGMHSLQAQVLALLRLAPRRKHQDRAARLSVADRKIVVSFEAFQAARLSRWRPHAHDKPPQEPPSE